MLLKLTCIIFSRHIRSKEGGLLSSEAATGNQRSEPRRSSSFLVVAILCTDLRSLDQGKRLVLLAIFIASSQLSATDVSAQATMKGAAKCDKHCELQNSVNQWAFERILLSRVSLRERLLQCLPYLCSSLLGRLCALRHSRKTTASLRSLASSLSQCLWRA